jgi:gluconolactonase
LYDEKYLYVDNSQPKKLWMRYRVKDDGTLTDAKVFYDATADKRPGAPDGMKVDRKGNVYSSGPGGIWIFTPEGKPLGTILMPENASNVAWGGTDRKTLYITGSSSVYRVTLKVPELDSIVVDQAVADVVRAPAASVTTCVGCVVVDKRSLLDPSGDAV